MLWLGDVVLLVCVNSVVHVEPWWFTFIVGYVSAFLFVFGCFMLFVYLLRFVDVACCGFSDFGFSFGFGSCWFGFAVGFVGYVGFATRFVAGVSLYTVVGCFVRLLGGYCGCFVFSYRFCF